MSQFSNKLLFAQGLIFLLVIYKISMSKLCKDPSQFLQFVKEFRSEVHNIQTEDGYNLTLFRIFPNINDMKLLSPKSLENKNSNTLKGKFLKLF